MSEQVTRLDDGQYLLVTQITDPLTYYADHREQCSHDAGHRSLRREKILPRLLWENVQGHVVSTPDGSVVFDDTVLDKNTSFAIAWGRSQESGNATAVLKGLGGVTCVSVPPATAQLWLMDSRLYDPAGEGTSKLDHVRAMLTNGVYQKQWPVHAVLMDMRDATKDLRRFIASLHQRSSCPLTENRPVDDSGGERASQGVDSLAWSAHALAHGKRLTSKGFPNDHTVPCLRVAVSPHRTDSVVTTAQAQHSTEATREVCGFRWKIAPLHREGQHVTGLERCQCRQARIQCNHIGWAFLVWVRRQELAAQTGRTVDQLQHGLVDDDFIQQLKNPSLKMVLA